MTIKNLLWSISLLFLLYGCASTSTKMVDTWSASDMQPEKWQKVLIVAIAKTAEGESAFENQLKSKIEKKKLDVVISTEQLPPDEKISKETFYKYFQDQNFDAVIVSRLASVQDLPGFSKPGHAPDFYTFYDQNYDQISVDFTDKNMILGVETRVYETKNLELIWSGLSKSFEPGKPKKLINDLAGAIYQALKEEGYY